MESNELKAVEDVQTQPEAVVASQTQPDPIADKAVALAESLAEKLTQAERDKENYKNGMLAKERQLKSLKDQGYEIEEPEERLKLSDVERLLDEKLASRQDKVTVVDDLSKQITELKTALVNRQGLPSTPTGNSTESQEVKPSGRWVDDPTKKAELLAKGLDPEKVYANWKANLQN